MSADGVDDLLEPGIPEPERAQLVALAERLHSARPLPSASFRGELRRRLLHAPSPRALRLRVASCLAGGVALLAVAGLGVAGSGPLAPQPLHAEQQTAAVQR